MAVNGRGTFLCYKYAAEQMIKQGRGGRIVGASSNSGKQGTGRYRPSLLLSASNGSTLRRHPYDVSIQRLEVCYSYVNRSTLVLCALT
jgi:NAD(P)-dependent dehydrogenase (short-subunit alcohol dehydrogenase family)